MATKVFISWSGELSKKLANEIQSWLPNVLQSVKPYFTPEDIQKGSRWEQEISKELESSNIGIICLTKDNINKPWIIFEAGALSKNIGKANVCPILFNLESSEVEYPLACFQATKFEKEDIKKLVKTINMSAGELKLEDANLNAIFEKWWPDLETNVNKIIGEIKSKRQTPKRADRDLLEEILELARMNSMRPPKRSDAIHYALERLLGTIDRIQFRIIENGEKEWTMYFEDMYHAIHMLCAEMGRPELFDKFMQNRARLMR